MLLMIGRKARAAAYEAGQLSSAQKDAMLAAIAQALAEQAGPVIAANEQDLAAARAAGMSAALIDRLTLTPARIEGMRQGIAKLIALEDPIGGMDSLTRRPNGLKIGKVRVPLGVIGIIYEARPNVTVDAAVLCIKSGNAVILRGGKEAIHANIALGELMRGAIAAAGGNPDLVQVIPDPSREVAGDMMRMNEYLDVLIPRGGKGLIRSVVEQASVPVIQTGDGNCHIYIDRAADLAMGVDIIDNAKTSRPSVCNAAETLLVHEDIAAEFLPAAQARLAEKQVELRGCARTCEILGAGVRPATAEDWDTEYLDYILAVRVVKDLDEAIAHINAHNTKHSEAIVTNDYAASQKFLDQVDAAAVYVNASTRFTDGEEFGFGAEIGISNQKIHARGPMGLKELTTTKYVIFGSGQIR